MHACPSLCINSCMYFSQVGCFGLSLIKLDIRQDSSFHTSVFDEICDFVGLLDNFNAQDSDESTDETQALKRKVKYSELEEEDRCRLLSQCLSTRRPVIPRCSLPFSDRSEEVIKTFRLCSSLGTEALGAYVVSMASDASDVLLVELLQREFVESEDQKTLRVVPLLETIEALQVHLSNRSNIHEISSEIDEYDAFSVVPSLVSLSSPYSS